jgi:uncharacterized protein
MRTRQTVVPEKITMLLRRIAFVWLLSVSTLIHAATDVPIPAFTPNVVDTTGTLRREEIAEINDTLLRIREKADIWGAVYILNTLQGESIESLSERAFRVWQLGQKGKDNGLLLVLVMKDRKSRFEVGYGLEGDLPDAIALRVLDNELAPAMRSGDVKTAIVNSFIYLAGVKSGHLDFTPAASTQSENAPKPEDPYAMLRGCIAYGLFLACLWVLPLFMYRVQRSRARQLATTDPSYSLGRDISLNRGKFSLKKQLFGSSTAVVLRLFFTLNPGAFLFSWAFLTPWGLPGVALLCALGVWISYRFATGRYQSKQAYDQWKGEQRAASHSSSGGSSSSSSSSGGGSSGGGGASSSW